VLLQGQAPPLYYTSQGQINALIPFQLGAEQQQLRVQRNGTASSGVDVLVANVQPGIFSLDSSGTGQAPFRSLTLRWWLVLRICPCRLNPSRLVVLSRSTPRDWDL
jgi:uncharacterized protein (TIGR03437 family)